MFTYCLITKGRRDYLPRTLQSLEEALLQSDVQVIVVDNGCPEDISEMLMNWCDSASTKSHYVRFDVNDTSAPRVWNMLRGYEIEWISFPGDDDIVCPDFLQHARGYINGNRNLSAIASSMRIIDSSGMFTGQLRQPASYVEDRIEYLAKALHEPPFQFPGLFLKFDKVTIPLPHSRYIFDWWLSLNLITLGPIVASSEISVNYRVHGDQESSLAPNRRKYFEAQMVITRFLNGENFEKFLFSLSDNEKMRFWRVVAQHRPVYGDVEFGKTIFSYLTLKIADSMNSPSSSSSIIGELADLNGVFLREGELKAFMDARYSGANHEGANFQLSIAKGSCQELLQLNMKQPGDQRNLSSFLAGCSHSDSPAPYKIDCDLFRLNPEVALDSLIFQITQKLESVGKFDFKVSPTERALVERLRSIKRVLPIGLVKRTKEKLMDGKFK
jgi:glycosyltransferase involved in cell wall biosynthesis